MRCHNQWPYYSTLSVCSLWCTFCDVEKLILDHVDHSKATFNSMLMFDAHHGLSPLLLFCFQNAGHKAYLGAPLPRSNVLFCKTSYYAEDTSTPRDICVFILTSTVMEEQNQLRLVVLMISHNVLINRALPCCSLNPQVHGGFLGFTVRNRKVVSPQFPFIKATLVLN